MEFYDTIGKKYNWQNECHSVFKDSLPSFVSSITLLCRDKLTFIFPEFVTAFSVPDVEPIEMSPFLIFTSVTPERGKIIQFNSKYYVLMTCKKSGVNYLSTIKVQRRQRRYCTCNPIVTKEVITRSKWNYCQR